jgi:hypothetical protein
MSSKTSIGTPSGLLGDLTMTGGMALMMTAFVTRPLPWPAT